MEIELIQVEVEQKAVQGCQDSFFYDGDIATLSLKDRYVLIVATGEIRIHDMNGDLVHDGYKERNGDFPEFKHGIDSDHNLAKLEGLGYTWENNNWFEIFWKMNEDDEWDCAMGTVAHTYDDAMSMAKGMLLDDEWWEKYKEIYKETKNDL